MSIQHNRVGSEASFSIDSGELRHGVFIRGEDTADSNSYMAINEVVPEGSSIANPAKFNNNMNINFTERLKLPEIDFKKRTGSYDVGEPQMQKIQKMQARMKQGLISKRKPSMNLPSPSSGMQGSMKNANIKQLNPISSQNKVGPTPNTVKNSGQSLSKKTLAAYQNSSNRVPKYQRENLIYN